MIPKRAIAQALTISLGLLSASLSALVQGKPASKGQAHLAPGGIAAAVAENKYYRGHEDYDLTNAPASLEHLAAFADAVIVGRALENHAFLSMNGRRIYTGYSVNVDQVLKGAREALPTSIAVLVLGGKVSFPNGATAQIEYLDFEKPQTGVRSVYFLRVFSDMGGIPATSGTRLPEDRFELASGPLGLYRLDGPSVRPAGGRESFLASEIRRKRPSATAFLQELEAILRKNASSLASSFAR